jgi:hypothetical protein
MREFNRQAAEDAKTNFNFLQKENLARLEA